MFSLDHALKEKITKQTKEAKAAELLEVTEKLKRLQDLYRERKELENGIEVIRKQDNQTDQDKKDIARFHVRRAEVNNEIKGLETNLRAKATRSPLLALMILPIITSGATAAAVYSIGQQEKVL